MNMYLEEDKNSKTSVEWVYMSNTAGATEDIILPGASLTASSIDARVEKVQIRVVLWLFHPLLASGFFLSFEYLADVPRVLECHDTRVLSLILLLPVLL
jgi:hypothetical protein